jgi:hypothetical protein
VLLGNLSVLFETVTQSGNTGATPIDPASAGTLPGGFTVFDDLAFNITTTATVSGPVLVCFTVEDVNDPQVFATLRVLHGENGVLVDRTVLPPDSPAPDFATRTLCARVTSLSPFVVARLLNQPPVARCKDAVIPAGAGCVATVAPFDLDDGSFDPDGDPITLSVTPPGPLGPGTHPMVLTVTDGQTSRSCAATLTVEDTTAPDIGTLATDHPVLGPPNHSMVDVALSYVATDNCGVPSCLVGVSSNEPVNGTGDGDTAPDWEVLDAHHVQLRAERAGNGNGRLYSVAVTCSDQAANQSAQTVTVAVPH